MLSCLSVPPLALLFRPDRLSCLHWVCPSMKSLRKAFIARCDGINRRYVVLA
jgi:hypothetical protein